MSKSTHALERLFGRVLSPFEHFLSKTTSGGIVLIAMALLALALATWPGNEAMDHVWEQTFGIESTAYRFQLS